MKLLNKTELAADLSPSLDGDGRVRWLVVLKGTFGPHPNGGWLLDRIASKVRMSDEYYGEPGRSSLRCESDLGDHKPNAELYLVDPQACVPLDFVGSSFGVAVEFEGCACRLRIEARSGRELRLERRLGSEEGGCLRVPIRYESTADPAIEDLLSAVSPDSPLRALRTSFEAADHEQPRADPSLLPGLTPLAKHWLPRRLRCGTADASWQRNRFPLPPTDFDDSYWNCAPAPLQRERPFDPGELIRLTGLTPDGTWCPYVPRFPTPVALVPVNSTTVLASGFRLDTIVLHPSERQLEASWRCLVYAPLGSAQLIVDTVDR